jgi:hypothetical protein
MLPAKAKNMERIGNRCNWTEKERLGTTAETAVRQERFKKLGKRVPSSGTK